MTGALESNSRRKGELTRGIFVLSADSHVNEPNDLWAKRIEAKFRDRVPRVEIDSDGKKWMIIEGFRSMRVREAPKESHITLEELGERESADGQGPRELDRTRDGVFTFQDVGAWEAEKRYRDLDYDGIDAEIVFPNKGLAMWASPDPEHNTAMCRVWNDWAIEVFGDSERSYPVAAIAPRDLETAVAEVQRVARLGYRAVMMPTQVPEAGYNLPAYDRLWAALSDANLPICYHVGTGKDPRTASGHGGAIINFVVHACYTAVEPVVQLCSSGILDRYPRLRFATVEAGIGWLAHTLAAMDEAFDKHSYWVRPKLKMRPSEYFRLHGYASFQDDRVGIETRQWIGTDRLLWGNDYPHLEGTWPHSERVIGSNLYDLGAAERRMVLGQNAAKFLGIEMPAWATVDAEQQ